MSSRAEHYRRAEGILAPLDKRVREGNGLGPMGPQLVELAQVHATLAAADPEAAGEYAERRVLGHAGPVVGGTREEPTVFGMTLDQVAELVDLRGKLAKVMTEMDRRGGAPTTFRDVATLIRLGLGEGR